MCKRVSGLVSGALSGRQSQIVLWKLQTNSRAIRSRCLKSSKRSVKSARNPQLNKLFVQKNSSFPFPYFCYLLQISKIFFCFSFLHILHDSSCFLSFLGDFAREIGARPANPFTHAQRLTAISVVLRKTQFLKTTCAKLSKRPSKIITDRSSSQDFFHTDDQIPRSNDWYSAWRSYSNWLRMGKYLFMKTVSDAAQIRLVWARCMLTLKKKTAAIKIIK